MPAQQHTALILEDVIDAQLWLSAALREIYPDTVIHTAATVAQALILIDELKFNIALLDLNLPDGSGIDAIRKFRHCHPETLTIVVTIYADDSHLFPALKAGAQGYLLKEQRREQIVERLRGIERGEPPLSPAIARRVLAHFGQQEPIEEIHLTPRERDVLTLIAKGIKLAKVAEMLEITHNTAAGYVKNIYNKLDISSRAEATIEATRLGLISPQ